MLQAGTGLRVSGDDSKKRFHETLTQNGIPGEGDVSDVLDQLTRARLPSLLDMLLADLRQEGCERLPQLRPVPAHFVVTGCRPECLTVLRRATGNRLNY